MDARFVRYALLAAVAMVASACAGTPGTVAQPEAGADPAVPAPPSDMSVLASVQDGPNGGYRLRVIDPATGDAEPDALDLPIDGVIGAHAFSEDGRFFAFTSGDDSYCAPYAGGSACWGGSSRLQILDTQTWQTVGIDLPQLSRVSSMVFDPTGMDLALAFHDRTGAQLLLVDVLAAAIRARSALLFDPSACGFTCTSLAFTQDGDGLLAFGADLGERPGIDPPGPAQVALMETQDLTLLWQAQLDDLVLGNWCLQGCDSSHEFYVGAVWHPAVVWNAADGRLLAFHAEADRLSTIDTAQRAVRSVDLHQAQTWLDRLMAWGAFPAFAKGASQGTERRAVPSPDGTRVYTLGTTYHAAAREDETWDMWTEALGLDVIDPIQGVRLTHLDTEADDLALTGDGRWLLLFDWGRGEPRSEILDAVFLETRAAFEGWSLRTGRSLEGKTVILAYLETERGTTLYLVDEETLERHPQWAARVVLFLR
jgi:hypothetical protein